MLPIHQQRMRTNGEAAVGGVEGSGDRARQTRQMTMLDDIDRTILDLLQRDARMPNAEIARQVGLAPSAISQRVRKLEERGILLGYHARVDASRLGSDLLAFVMIQTAQHARAQETADMLSAIPHVLEVHRVVGEHCFILKVRVRGPDELGVLLDEVIQPLPPVASTQTIIVLRTHKESFGIPLPPADPSGG